MSGKASRATSECQVGAAAANSTNARPGQHGQRFAEAGEATLPARRIAVDEQARCHVRRDRASPRGWRARRRARKAIARRRWPGATRHRRGRATAIARTAGGRAAAPARRRAGWRDRARVRARGPFGAVGSVRPSSLESHAMRPETIAADPSAAAAPARAADAAAKALWPGLALAMAGSIAFSGKAIIVKLAYRHGVDAVTLIMYRMLFALPLFALLAWWAGRGRPTLTRRDWLVVSGPRLQRLLPRQLPRLRGAGVHHGEPRAAHPLPQPDARAGARRRRASSAGSRRAR